MTQSWAFVVDSVPFTHAVVAGETSLGGSESACLGLARALVTRGHDVHVFATKLAEDAVGPDAAGLVFHPIEQFAWMNQFVEWDVVCALRQPYVFTHPVHARLRLLWNQDLLLPETGKAVMAVAWALDHLVYVSDYHRRQWEDLQPEIAPIGWVTKNGFDPAHVPADATKDPHRIIHVSRPERGLGPQLAMWPELRRQDPHAELRLCRYASMYDGEGSQVKATCESFDEAVARVNEAVGGITYLGSLTKAQLYREIADAAVMWYPGVDTFAETSCIAAIEAQACGTPFVGSWKGALPETVPGGVLIKGDADTPEYQRESIAHVLEMLRGCATRTFAYRQVQTIGRKHVAAYTYAEIAAEWEARVEDWFTERYEANKPRILQQLLHEDDHVAAKVVARDILHEHGTENPEADINPLDVARYTEAVAAQRASEFCDRVIAGLEQGAETYAAHAIQDPLKEVALSGRFQSIAPHFKDCTRVLDVACGNGAGAITLALAHPALHVVGIDYAAHNIEIARDAAQRAGVADRCTFEAAAVWDLPNNRPAMPLARALAAVEGRPFGECFDGLFVGEFVEHVADCTTLVDFLETFLAPGATVVYTCPMGPFGELMPRGMPIQRGHVHCFKSDDVRAVWGEKLDVGADFFAIGMTPRGNPIGHWIIHYRRAVPTRPAGRRALDVRTRRTRPLQRLSVGLLAQDAGLDLARCLNSVWPIAEEIVIGDTGSVDDTRAIAAAFGARVLTIAPIDQQPQGFAGARNAVLDACTGDWFLWIDTDEQLLGTHMLRSYLEGPTFEGFVLRQHNVYLDAPPAFEIPTRLFRRTPDIRFYGCVHEQPQKGDANTEPHPTLDPEDVRLVHFGYLTADVREAKRSQRNRPLLIRDQQAYPERRLGKALLLREAVIQSDYERQTAGQLTARAAQGYQHAIQLFVTYFDDPADKFAQIVRPWYQAALQHLGIGWEMEIALAGRAGVLGGLGAAQAKPERVWVRDAAEFERLMAHRLQPLQSGMRAATPLKTDPFVTAAELTGATA